MKKESDWLLRDKYNGVISEQFYSDLKRLENGEPLAYIIGWVPFLNIKIYLDSKPLIPRPETEYWASCAIEEIKTKKISKPRVLDLCAGSGCIGVAVLKEIPGATVDFVEIDPLHHTTIKKNVKENGIDVYRACILGGDLFENISSQYDVILSNPPYIDPKLSFRVEPGVANHEPEAALYGGEAGIEVLARILREAPQHLKTGGSLYIEHEPEQEEKLKKLNSGLVSYPDQFGTIRYSRI